MKAIKLVGITAVFIGIAVLAAHSGAIAEECTLTSQFIVTIKPEPLKAEIAFAETGKNALLSERVIKVEEVKGPLAKKTRYTLSEKL